MIETGAVMIMPPEAVIHPGEELEITIVFSPGTNTTVTGLDACLDFDPQVFDEPSVTQHFITEEEMSDFSMGNSWTGHPDSFHYERIAMPSDTGWTVFDETDYYVYSITFPVKSNPVMGQTAITFTQNFITFSDQYGEILDPTQITEGNYNVASLNSPTPVQTQTPTPVPTAAPVPAFSPAGGFLLLMLFFFLLRFALPFRID